MSRLVHFFALLAVLCLTALPAVAQVPNQALDAVKARGLLRCGVWGDLPGFSAPDSAGLMRGLDADFCRAAAAAALGDATKVEFLRFASPGAGLQAVAAGDIDLLARNTTITLGRDAGFAVAPVGVLYFDGQGFLATRQSGIAGLRDLAGKRICAGTGGGLQSARVVDRMGKLTGQTMTIVPADDSRAAFAAFKAGACEVVTADRSALAIRRITELPDPAAAVLLPEVISREPLGPWVRAGQESWRELMFWVLQALITAEELGITSGNLALMLHADDPEVRMLLGFDPAVGAALGVAPDFALQVIRQVGNYGEIYERTLGPASGIGLDRGLSDIWLRGGLMFGMPMR